MNTDDLVQIELIRQLKARYLRGIDTKDWALLEASFTPDAVARYSGGKYSYEGRDSIMEFLRTSMGREDFLSCHRCSHPEISIGPDGVTAAGTWALQDYVIVGEYDLVVHGAAFYTDEYRKVSEDGVAADPSGQWLISRTGYRRTFEQIFPRSSIDGLQLTASWWGTDGQSTLPVA